MEQRNLFSKAVSVTVLTSLIVLSFFSGCAMSNPTSPGVTTPFVNTTSSPGSIPIITVTTIETLPPATSTALLKDPIIGSWQSFKYLPTGKIELIWTFSENNSWTLVNTNVKSQHKKFVHGAWSKSGADTYRIATSGSPTIFTYDRANDAFSDTFFLVTYKRITGAIIPHESVPTMNLTLYSAEIVSTLNGARPYTGYKYLMVNVSIKNINESGWFDFADDRIWAIPDNETGSYSSNQKLGGKLENPFPAGKIVPGETRQGNVVFGIPVKSQSYTLKLINSNGETISNTLRLESVPVTTSGSTSPT